MLLSWGAAEQKLELKTALFPAPVPKQAPEKTGACNVAKTMINSHDALSDSV